MDQTHGKPLINRSPDTLKSLDALEKFTLPVIDYFTKALTHEDKWVRYLAAEALGCVGDAQAIEPLNRLRADKDADLRFVSCQSLKNIRYMQEILSDSRKEDGVRYLPYPVYCRGGARATEPAKVNSKGWCVRMKTRPS